VRCRGIDVDWHLGPEYRHEWLEISLPQRCLGADAGTVNVQAGTGERDGPGGDVAPELGSRQYERQSIPRG
jgi:hypothetical protein